jgi:hypothetical protein
VIWGREEEEETPKRCDAVVQRYSGSGFVFADDRRRGGSSYVGNKKKGVSVSTGECRHREEEGVCAV